MAHWHWLLVVPVLMVVALVLFLSSTTPLQVGPAGILLVFLLLYAALLSVSFLVVFVGSKLLAKLGIHKQTKTLHPKRAYYISSVIACLPLFLIAIQTTRQLRITDVVLVSVFIGLATFYVVRRT